MALKKKSKRTPIRPRPGYLPRLPHPSWRLAALGGSEGGVPISLASASEFWSRLGL